MKDLGICNKLWQMEPDQLSAAQLPRMPCGATPSLLCSQSQHSIDSPAASKPGWKAEVEQMRLGSQLQ